MRASVWVHLCFHCYSKKLKERKIIFRNRFCNHVIFFNLKISQCWKTFVHWLFYQKQNKIYILYITTINVKIQSCFFFCICSAPELTELLMSLWVHEASDGCRFAASVSCVWWNWNQHQRAYIDFLVVSFLLISLIFFFCLFVFTSNDYQTHYDLTFLM